MATVTSAMILEAKNIKSVTVSTFSPSICHEVMGHDDMILVFECWTLSQLSHSSFSPISRGSLVPLHFLPLEWYLHICGCRHFLAILIPDCNSFSPTFHMIYSAYNLNKQGDNMQLYHTLFSILNLSLAQCKVLTVVSWFKYLFLRSQVRWAGIPFSLRIFEFVVIYTVKGFWVVNEVEADIFLEFSCFLYGPVNVGSLTSGSSAYLNQTCSSRRSRFT